jgi:hypothetical protein
MVHYDGSTVIFRVLIQQRRTTHLATGFAEEVLGNSPVNKTILLRKCETSGIGRMISMGL